MYAPNDGVKDRTVCRRCEYTDNSGDSICAQVLTQCGRGLDQDGEQYETLCSDVLGQLIVVQDDVQDGFREIRVYGGEVRREALYVMCDHSTETTEFSW